MYDEVGTCVYDHDCTEDLKYVAQAAGQVRGTIHSAVNLVVEGCRLHGGAGLCSVCWVGGVVQAAWGSRSVFCVLGWWVWRGAGCMGAGLWSVCWVGGWVGGVVQAAWGEPVCVVCVGLVVCVEGCWLHGGAGRCSVCWVGLVWRGVGCMREQVGALCVGLVRVG